MTTRVHSPLNVQLFLYISSFLLSSEKGRCGKKDQRMDIEVKKMKNRERKRKIGKEKNCGTKT